MVLTGFVLNYKQMKKVKIMRQYVLVWTLVFIYAQYDKSKYTQLHFRNSKFKTFVLSNSSIIGGVMLKTM